MESGNYKVLRYVICSIFKYLFSYYFNLFCSALCDGDSSCKFEAKVAPVSFWGIQVTTGEVHVIGLTANPLVHVVQRER
jgi:hypothetical protein